MKRKGLDAPDKRSAFVSSFDWDRMTRQDKDVWDKILAHLEK
jgi:hypothetical protein